MLNSNKQEMFNGIWNYNFVPFWGQTKGKMPKNEYWKGCRGRYVSIGIEEQLDTTWWEELQDAWDLSLPNIIFQG